MSTTGAEAMKNKHESAGAWLADALPVKNEWDALEAACGDTPYLLESEDLEGDVSWVLASAPIPAGDVWRGRRETDDEWSERMAVVRAVPANEMWPAIFFMSATAELELIDGGHRISLAIDQGEDHIHALVRVPGHYSRLSRETATQ